MALVKPHEATFAVKINSNAWNADAIAVGAGDGFEPSPPGVLIVPNREYQEDVSLHGEAGRRKFDRANHLPDFSVDSINARYAGALNRYAALLFGKDTVSAIQEGTVEVGKKHLITMLKSLDGKNATLAIDWINAILELDHFKVDSMTLAQTVGERATWSINGMGRQWRNNSAINTSTELNMVTVTTPLDYLLSDQLEVFLNNQSDADFVAGDALAVNAFSLELNRAIDAPVTTADAPYRDEPVAPAPGWIGTLSLELPRWQNLDLQDKHEAGSQVKARLKWTGALLNGASTEVLTFIVDVPGAQILPYELTEQGTIGETPTLELYRAATIPTGMSDQSVYLEIHNNEITAYI